MIKIAVYINLRSSFTLTRDIAEKCKVQSVQRLLSHYPQLPGLEPISTVITRRII